MQKGTGEYLEVEYVDPGILKPYPHNPKTLSDDARVKLKEIIKRHGLVKPLTVRLETKEVLDGNQRLKVVQDIGVPKIPVTYVQNLTDAEARALNIALINEDAGGDIHFEMLAETVLAAEGMGVMPEAMGYSYEDIEDMMTWSPEDDELDQTRDDEDASSQVIECPHCGADIPV